MTSRWKESMTFPIEHCLVYQMVDGLKSKNESKSLDERPKFTIPIIIIDTSWRRNITIVTMV